MPFGMEIIAGAGLVLNVFVAVVGLTWGLGKVRDAIRSEIESHRVKFDDELTSTERNIGQSLQALREKIREVELFCRDTFVRRESFTEVINRISQDIKGLSDRIDGRLERIENKIDKA